MDQERPPIVWKSQYTLVLVVNAIYMVLFYWLMISFT